MTKPSSLEPRTEEELRQKIAAGSQDPKDYIDFANLACEAGRYDEAVSLLQQGLSLNLSNFEKGRMCWHLAWLFLSLDKPEQALTQAEKARDLLSIEPENPEVMFLRGTTKSLLAQCSTDADSSKNTARIGLRWLDRLIAEAPEFENIVFAYIQAARLHNLLGNPQEAIRVCKESLEKDLCSQDRLDCLLELAESLRLESRFAEAEHGVTEAFKCAEANKGRLPQLYFTLGLIQRGWSRPAEAREAFQKTLVEIETQPHLPGNPGLLKDTYWNLGELYYELGEYEKAVSTFRELLILYPEDDLYRRNAFVWLGQSYHGMGALTEARNCYEQVLTSANASDIERASTQQGVGKIYYDLGHYDEAIVAFQRVLACFTWDDAFYGDSLIWLGSCYEAKGDYEKARDCYEEVQASPHASERERAVAEESLARLPQVSKKILH